MSRKLLIGIVSCILAMGMQAETIRVLRFVTVDGSESEVEQSSLQKVVFTRDSVVLIAAESGEAMPLYKYEYRSVVFEERTSPEGVEEVKSEELRGKGEKFIKDGQLYIRLGEQVYNILGLKIEDYEKDF